MKVKKLGYEGMDWVYALDPSKRPPPEKTAENAEKTKDEDITLVSGPRAITMTMPPQHEKFHYTYNGQVKEWPQR